MLGGRPSKSTRKRKDKTVKKIHDQRRKFTFVETQPNTRRAITLVGRQQWTYSHTTQHCISRQLCTPLTMFPNTTDKEESTILFYFFHLIFFCAISVFLTNLNLWSHLTFPIVGSSSPGNSLNNVIQQLPQIQVSHYIRLDFFKVSVAFAFDCRDFLSSHGRFFPFFVVVTTASWCFLYSETSSEFPWLWLRQLHGC